jgi:hypothetical protein
MLGRFFFYPSPCSGSTLCQSQVYNIGSFQIDDTFGQIDNAFNQTAGANAIMNNTTRVSWNRVIDGMYNATTGAASAEQASRVLLGLGSTFHTRFDHKLLGPTLELGFESSSFFAVFFAASFFNFDNNISRSAVVPVAFGRRGFQDTFSFFTDFSTTRSWPSLDFNSSTRNPADPRWNTQGTIVSCFDRATDCTGTECPGCAGTEEANFRIWPDGVGQGTFPVRAFYEVFPAGVNDSVEEDITHRLDISIFEGRLGGKSWFPIFGFGRLAFSLGGAYLPIHYTVSGTRNVFSLGPHAPGVIIDSRIEVLDGWWLWNFGGFAAAEVELQIGSFLARLGAEYVLSYSQTVKVLEVNTTINPGGLGALATVGFAF